MKEEETPNAEHRTSNAECPAHLRGTSSFAKATARQDGAAGAQLRIAECEVSIDSLAFRVWRSMFDVRRFLAGSSSIQHLGGGGPGPKGSEISCIRIEGAYVGGSAISGPASSVGLEFFPSSFELSSSLSVIR